MGIKILTLVKKALTIAEAQATATQKTMTAQAEGTKATLLAQADGDKAKLLAHAEGTQAELLAVAAGEKAKLLAQAEGNKQLAEALKQLSADGKLMFVLDRLPQILDHGGDAGQKVARAIFEPVAAGVAKIGSVNITDLGGGNSAKNGMGNMGGIVVQTVVDFFAKAKASGVNVDGLLKLLKMDPAVLASFVGPLTEALPKEAAPMAPETK